MLWFIWDISHCQILSLRLWINCILELMPYICRFRSAIAKVLHRKGPPSQKVYWGWSAWDRVVVSDADHKAKGPKFASQWRQLIYEKIRESKGQ